MSSRITFEFSNTAAKAMKDKFFPLLPYAPHPQLQSTQQIDLINFVYLMNSIREIRI